jgi:hypothetical protein
VAGWKNAFKCLMKRSFYKTGGVLPYWIYIRRKIKKFRVLAEHITAQKRKRRR